MKTTIKNFVAVAYDELNMIIADTNSVYLLGLLNSHNYPKSWFTEGRQECRARLYRLNEEVPVF